MQNIQYSLLKRKKTKKKMTNVQKGNINQEADTYLACCQSILTVLKTAKEKSQNGGKNLSNRGKLEIEEKFDSIEPT